MIITDEFKKKLRKYLHEVIPPDGTDKDTNLSDEDIEELLTEADNIYSAAAQGWRLKATTAPMEVGQITKYSIGQETYEKSTASDYLSYCLEIRNLWLLSKKEKEKEKTKWQKKIIIFQVVEFLQ